MDIGVYTEVSPILLAAAVLGAIGLLMRYVMEQLLRFRARSLELLLTSSRG
ncbi:MAG: hypothetical protein ACUVV1_05020 [Fimbriimonadales bacterium]